MDRRKFTTLGAASAIALLGPRQLRAQGTQPLKIGIMNDLSSVYADFQGFGSKIAAELAVADYAAKAGVAVEVVIADHQNKPDIGSGLAPRPALGSSAVRPSESRWQRQAIASATVVWSRRRYSGRPEAAASRSNPM